MKIIQVLIAIVFISIAVSSFSQTSQEEYNYITKGYKVQIESGLDMKKGYSFEDIDLRKTSERTAQLKAFYKTKEGNKKELVAYMIIYTRSGKASEYICIPHPKSEDSIMKQYWKQLHEEGTDSSMRLQLISYLISTNMKW